MKLSPERNLKQLEIWKHCDIKSSMVLGGICFGSGSSGTGWLAALFGTGSTFPLCCTALYWCRNARALGFSSLGLILVSFPHIILAEHSKANQVQQGHVLSKVIPWIIAETRKVPEFQITKQGILLTRRVILSVIDRVWEREIVLDRYVLGGGSNKFCLIFSVIKP